VRREPGESEMEAPSTGGRAAEPFPLPADSKCSIKSCGVMGSAILNPLGTKIHKYYIPRICTEVSHKHCKNFFYTQQSIYKKTHNSVNWLLDLLCKFTLNIHSVPRTYLAYGVEMIMNWDSLHRRFTA